MATIKSFKKGKKQAKIELNGFTVNELIKALQEEKNKKKEQATIYDNLQSIYESEDKKAIVFSFENRNKFKFNLPDSRFYHAHSNKLINSNNFDVQCYDLSSAKMSALSTESWIKTFFNLIENLAPYGRRQLLDIIDASFSKRKVDKDILFLCEQASKQEFVQKLNQDQISLLAEIINDNNDYSILREIIKNKKDYCWLFENYSNISANVDRHDGTILFFFNIAKRLGCLEHLKYAFDNYRYVFSHEDWEIIKYLLKNGYEATRLLTYICRDMPNQGIDYYNHDNDECCLHILRDYVRMNIQMKNDFEKYPRYLRTYHDVTVKNYNIAKNKSFNTRMKRVAKSLEKYHYQNDVYSIVAPKSAEDLIEEGIRLNHCVASYIEDVANKETAILFLRKNSDLKSSLVTMEIKNNRIVQVKGKNNSNPQPEEKRFIDDYKKYLANIK